MADPLRVSQSQADEQTPGQRRESKVRMLYVLFLVAFLSVQFGHGSNIGVAVSLPIEGHEQSAAMNMALGSWVMGGVCIGLCVTPWVCRTFGVFQVCVVCVVVDTLVILLMCLPKISLKQIYTVRFLVGFFEAPFLPYLQEWLARFGKHNWNVWNTVLHATVPLGEILGYITAQELVAMKLSWQLAFAGQAVILASTVGLCWFIGESEYLDLSPDRHAQTYMDRELGGDEEPSTCVSSQAENEGGCDSSLENESVSEVEYPVTERWAVYWATNASLASQLGFLSGLKYVIRAYGEHRGFSVHFVIFVFSAIALIGPALGGSIAMSGSVIRPDQWSQHKRTLAFLACTASVAAGIAVFLPYTPELLFWPALFAAFVSAGGVYPAAQGIINIALTESRVIEASVWQVQCNNVLFAMPMPYLIGKAMDKVNVDFAMHCVVFLQVLAALGFVFAIAAATFTEERNTWHRMLRNIPRPSVESQDGSCSIELSRPSDPDEERERFLH